MKNSISISLLVLLAFVFPNSSLDVLAADYSKAIPSIEKMVQEQIDEWGVNGIAVALVDGQELVYSAGFGEAEKDSIFRVGSISKLFNAVAVMQQVEKGKLNLDAPISRDLLPINPFPGEPAVTLRQLLCHRSGLQRESTVGGYLDPSEPGIAATVASIRGAVLATRPDEKTRYSNIGPTLAGYLVEQASGQSYAAYQKKHVLRPLGMEDATWLRRKVGKGRLISSYMRVADGQGGWTRRVSPVFDLGTIPAGNLFSSAGDLARFAMALLADGRGLVEPETLREMWTPQLTDAEAGFGLGFYVGKFRDHQSVRHTGAVYGHSCSFVVLPDAGISVIVLANEDISSGRVSPISNLALSLMLEAKLGETPPTVTPELVMDDPEKFTGEFESQSYWAKLEIRNGRLVGDMSGQPLRLRATAPLKFTADSRIHNATPVNFTLNEAGNRAVKFTLGGQTFERVSPNPKPLPNHWRKFLGTYGHDFIPLIVTERHGHLYVMTENMVDYRLHPENLNVCELPPGMYINEHMIFLTNENGVPDRINFCNMLFERSTKSEDRN